MVFFGRNSIALTVILLALFVVSSNPAPALAQAEEAKPDRRSPPQAKFTDKGVEGCLSCHGGVLMTLMADTVHGNKNNPHTPYAAYGCESCHGPGSLHSSKARGGVGFPPLLSFRAWESVQENNKACMSCHGKTMGRSTGMMWYGNLHQVRGMTCAYCHETHSTVNKMNDRQMQRENCNRCHRRQIEDHPPTSRSFSRRKCSACHDLHNPNQSEEDE